MTRVGINSSKNGHSIEKDEILGRLSKRQRSFERNVETGGEEVNERREVLERDVDRRETTQGRPLPDHVKPVLLP